MIAFLFFHTTGVGVAGLVEQHEWISLQRSVGSNVTLGPPTYGGRELDEGDDEEDEGEDKVEEDPGGHGVGTIVWLLVSTKLFVVVVDAVLIADGVPDVHAAEKQKCHAYRGRWGLGKKGDVPATAVTLAAPFEAQA